MKLKSVVVVLGIISISFFVQGAYGQEHEGPLLLCECSAYAAVEEAARELTKTRRDYEKNF